ncbi:hypothetical protein SAMN05443667_107159 [Flavobacterium gillisiae]|uniref:Lipocalin-like domain-containing protein n=1 Tax=Flavobacterium gillisiae TaxID=150146 RepID=A0A1H4DC08_9FLAO|nr:hypothetical protein [Flavobacterium gillisiae]SEA70254.1 hypothetical protein SAMN05443667_107159 [Flavobacterium gillisiae]
MKSAIIIFIAFTLLTSCSGTDVDVSETSSQGKWELVKMSGRTLNSEASGAAMEWQEFYLLNDNGTFTKSRTRDGNTSKSAGTYKTTITSTETYFELTYSSQSDIIGSCYGNLKEELYYDTTDVLVSTWQNCDGPRLEYRKTN